MLTSGGADRMCGGERSGCVERVQSGCRAGAAWAYTEYTQSRCTEHRCRAGVQSGCADLRGAQVNLRQHRVGGTLRRVQSAQRRAHVQRVEAQVLARGTSPVVAHGHRTVERTE